ncbi:MAG: hypothetical protein AB7Q76_01450 [Gammaproteobacteria bacterium]
MNNKYVFNPFSQHHNGIDSLGDWKGHYQQLWTDIIHEGPTESRSEQATFQQVKSKGPASGGALRGHSQIVISSEL